MRKPKAERQGIVAKLRSAAETGDGYPHLLLDIRLLKKPRKNKKGNLVHFSQRYAELPVSIPTAGGENDLDVAGLNIMTLKDNIAPDTEFTTVDDDEEAVA